ncbi:MAG: hypothetical protein J4G12_07210 [Gemmatimonadetes bacterium]|nr:hypothetical protein [Gemmatimonadota bacterium]
MLDDLGNLGEFLGATGVIVSLFFVVRQMKQNALQMRHNTRTVRAAAFNSMVENSMRLLEHVFRNRELAEFLAKVAEDPDGLSEADRLRWDSYMTTVYRHFGNLLYQWEVGAIETKLWESYLRSLKDHLRDPSWANWYMENSHLFDERLADVVRSLLGELADEGIPHAVAWREQGSTLGFRAAVEKLG